MILGIILYVLIICWLWLTSNKLRYGLLIKSSCIFITVLQFIGYVWCFYFYCHSENLMNHWWWRVMLKCNYNFVSMLQNSDFVFTCFVSLVLLLCFALGVWLSLKSKYYKSKKFIWQEDYNKNQAFYKTLCFALSVVLIIYFYLCYKYAKVYPWSHQTPRTFRDGRYVCLLWYSSVICGIGRTFPFFVFVMCYFRKGIVSKIFSFFLFCYGCLMYAKRSSLLYIGMILVYFCVIFSSRKYLWKILFLCCMLFPLLYTVPQGKRIFFRVASSNVGDVLSFSYYKNNHQNFKYICSFIKKCLGDRDCVTFAESYGSLLVNNNSYNSTGVGCIAASWINFGWLGLFEMFFFGLFVGFCEEFFEKRERFGIYWFAIYVLFAFQVGNIFVISFLSSLVQGGIIITVLLCVLGLLFEKYFSRENN